MDEILLNMDEAGILEGISTNRSFISQIIQILEGMRK